MAQTFFKQGYTQAPAMENADVVIINTCSIREKAKQKVMSLLGYLRKTQTPHRQIVVAGCVAQQDGREILQKMEHVTLVVGTQNIYHIPELLKNRRQHSSPRLVDTLEDSYRIPQFIPDPAFTGDAFAQPSALASNFSKFVTIMQGCNNYCTYCVVPYTRGRETSRRVTDIVDEVTTLIAHGALEITLLGQNVNSYGRTNSVANDSFTFPDLLRKVAEIEGVKRLRFTTSNPKDLDIELMRCFRELPNLCPQFHLPMQAGSNAVLKRMNRKYTREKYLELVDSLRQHCPEISLTTDVIVGFPGESDEDFFQTMDILEKVRFAGSFSFKYSDRPGTASIKLANKIPETVKAERLALFQKRQKEISYEINQSYIGRTLPVMVEKQEDNSYKCRTDTNHIVHAVSSKELKLGSLERAYIVQAGFHSLRGKII